MTQINKNKIVMVSKADMVKGQGVLSAHDEQVALVSEFLGNEYEVTDNKGVGDITHFHTINPEFLLKIPKAKRKGSTVGYVHFLPQTIEGSIHLPGFVKSLLNWYMVHFYRSMDHLVTVNPYFKKTLKEYGIPEEKIAYIPNVVSEEQFHSLHPKYKTPLRKKYHLKDKFTVLCVGQLQKRKGFFDFIEAAENLPNIQFVWAGVFAFGKISDGYEEIKEQMKHLPENVTLLGYIDRCRMNEIYNLADVLFLPSFEELFPMAVLEAMNVGLPVVLRNLPIYEEILSEYCLFGEEKKSLIGILDRLNQDGKYYTEGQRRSAEGRAYYSRKHVAAMWEAFYEKVLIHKALSKKKGGILPWRKQKAWLGNG